jgi:hypothetical protein
MSPIAAFLLGALAAGVLVVVWAALAMSSRDDDDR